VGCNSVSGEITLTVDIFQAKFKRGAGGESVAAMAPFSPFDGIPHRSFIQFQTLTLDNVLS
jgi:hypothetical protein